MSDAREWEQGPADCFAHQSVAARYAQSRPYFHPLVIGMVRDALALVEPVRRALDVGCGTGQSTAALREIADLVVGIDTSLAMLAHAPREAGLHYVVALAEQLPFARGAFNLITVSSAFHWLDRERFLTEAQRLLQPSVWLVVYDNAFSGIMEEDPRFQDWVRDVYATRFPAPPRDRRPLTAAEAGGHGFRLTGPERYTNLVSLSPGGLVDYLMTQSNVIAAVEDGRVLLEDVRVWLVAAVTPLVARPMGSFRFGGAIWYLHRR